jgi:serine/threonine-protein kinase
VALAPGTRLGAYEVTAQLGAGGMGEVYRAHDTTLGRDVALKVLPEAFAADADRVARFQREAKTLAALNHPHIAQIYGLEDIGAGGRALVMELVEGDDLSQRIARGPMPLDEALPIAKQIADALEAAHEQGIIHRDLKPANVKVRVDGTVKVLDFGLAKVLDPRTASSGAAALANSPTITSPAAMTAAGVVLGTATYMAPEQARGKAADKRADIWAFGVVLYEMLTGRRAFEGEEISDVLAAVLRQDLDWTALPASTPLRLRRVLERCLDRDPKTRLRDIGEARVEIAKIEAGAPESGISSTAAAAPPAVATRRVAPFVIATAVVAIAATFGLTRWVTPTATTTTSGAVAHVSVALPDGDELGSTNLLPLALSDDGARVAYVGLHDGKTQIYVRTLSESAPKALDGTEGGESPFFSPDGQWVAFFAGSKLRKIAVGGAALQTLADAPNQRGGAWGGDGHIYFAPTNIGGIWRVPEGGGTATEVTRKDPANGEISHRWPHVVTGTSTLLFAMWTGPGNDESNVAMQTIGAAEHHVLVKGGDAPHYAATPGVLLYFHLGELFAVPWRPSQTDLGRAVPVAMSEHTSDGGGNEGSGNYAISGNGTLAYIAGGRARNSTRLVWIDRAGKMSLAPLPERDYENATVSPDGTRAIVQIREATTALWVYDLARNTLTPIGNSAGSSQSPVWTADGARVIYRGTRKGFRNIYWRPVDGSGDEERLTTKPDVSQSPASGSPDGHWLVFNENGAQESGGVGIWVMRLDGDRTPHHFFPAPAGESDGQLSPDGKWMAYQASISSRQEIYVAPFPGPGPRRQVSTDGGTEPLWSGDGRELFFQNGARLMGVTVTHGAAFSASTPHPVHEGRFLKSINGNTDSGIARDGTRFLRIQQVEPERAITHIDLVLNWFAELKQLAVGK